MSACNWSDCDFLRHHRHSLWTQTLVSGAQHIISAGLVVMMMDSEVRKALVSSVLLSGESSSLSSRKSLPGKSFRVSNSPPGVSSRRHIFLALALGYRRRRGLRDSPALPLGGVGSDKQVHFHAEIQKLKAKVVSDDVVPIVIPLISTVDGLDAE